MNPLLDEAEWPAFDAIRPEHVTPALDQLLADAEAALAAAGGPDVAADVDALARVLDLPVERLRRAWGHVAHLQQVADTPALRAAFGANQPRITDFMTRLGADAGLYAKTKAIAAAPGFEALPPARRKAVRDAVRDFELGGAALQGAARERFAAIQARAAELSRRFGENVLDATDAWALDLPADRLAGVPADVVQAAQAAAQAAGVEGCRLTLHAPCRIPVLATAEDRALRETVYRAHIRLASEFGPAEQDNGPLMQELLALRAEEAALLGRGNYAELSLTRKMAESPAQVLGFLRDLAGRARPFAETELAALREHARSACGIAELQPWDRNFVAEKLKHERLGVDDETLRPWFTLPRVLDGLFELLQRLFELRFIPEPAPVWHPDVQAFRVERGGQPVGGVYLDLCARAGKQSGAWMDEVRARWRRPDGALQRPQAHLVCNFAPPVGGRPSLLTHDDVVTLFHEFGHGLHHLLTQVDELALSGISGVEWDAAELPSQFMENFCWEWAVLQRLTAHVDSGEPLPRELFERLLGTRHFGSGLHVMRGVEFGLFDMRLHAEPDTAGRVAEIARAAADEAALQARLADDRWPNSLLHIFDGGYEAGLYGYQWAEVLSADAYSAFEEAGVFDAATGARWREQVLETGGSRRAIDNFVAFRGRAPRLDALLRHQGLVAPA